MYKAYGKGTIRETLDAIQHRNLVLPAIQREFVWAPAQICQFFDSLMQGYPFGTFLYWEVNAENSSMFRWYDFVLNYHQKNSPHCPPHPTLHDTNLIAVLDGQQRLTALNIGLQGSMAWKLPRRHYQFDENYPIRRLHIDLLSVPDEEEGNRYKFEFLREDTTPRRSEKEYWFRVADIMGMHSNKELVKRLNNLELEGDAFDRASDTLSTLHETVHTKPLIMYYAEQSQNIENVLQIFIRMNSGGTFLSYSDLLLSIAVAHWDELDARKEIHGFVDALNGVGRGFAFSKDFVLKAGLVLSDMNVGFKVANFNRLNMDNLEANWPGIKESLFLGTRLVHQFGFDRNNLRAHNAILPIIYYLHASKRDSSFLTHSRHGEDRKAIRRWLISSLIKQGAWGQGTDTLLARLREIIRRDGQSRFPIEPLVRALGLTFNDEEIEDLVDMEAWDHRLYALLTLLFPFMDSSHEYHIDHIFPYARFNDDSLRTAGVPEDRFGEYKEKMNRLGNFQLLSVQENLAKSDKLPIDWLNEMTFPTDAGNESREGYTERRLLIGLPAGLDGFEAFYEARRDRLKERIKRLLG